MFWLRKGVLTEQSIKKNDEKPKVTVIVCLRNESDNVKNLITGLNSIVYPKDNLEIICVNDHSTDDTKLKLQKYAGKNIQVIDNLGSGKKKGIQSAVALSTGEWVLTTDADCDVSSEWVSGMVSSIKESTKMVLGPVFINPTAGLLKGIQSIEFFGLQAATLGSAAMGFPVSANGANMMFHKNTFETLNPFKGNYEFLSGDDQFLLMAISSKYPNGIEYSKEQSSMVTTHPTLTISDYFNQRIRWSSKAKGYKQVAPLLIGLVVLLMALLVVLSPLLLLTQFGPTLILAPLVVKMIADLLVVVPMKNFSGFKLNLLHYIISSMVYPLVIVSSVFLGFFKKASLKQPQNQKENW
jgi:cellulose synthase/poly-beta-1,6-N-acetylglucosamine synthase-like glycosyltransferase